MADTPNEAPAPAPTGESVATPNTNTNAEPAKPVDAPDMHGFTSEQLADMKKFFDNNGGFDGVKAKISNPEKTTQSAPEVPQTAPEPKNDNQPTSHTEQAPEPIKTPQGAITPQEFLAEQYFKSLAGEEKYANISKEIANGEYLKEMSAFGIQPLNPDGSINDQKVRMYLDLKSQTVPAKPTETEPNASAAPTVTYTEVGDNIANIDQAYKVLMEPGNPARQKAEEYIKNYLNPNSSKK